MESKKLIFRKYIEFSVNPGIRQKEGYLRLGSESITHIIFPPVAMEDNKTLS